MDATGQALVLLRFEIPGDPVPGNAPPSHMGEDSERDLRFDGFRAPPAGAEQQVPPRCLTHTGIV